MKVTINSAEKITLSALCMGVWMDSVVTLGQLAPRAVTNCSRQFSLSPGLILTHFGKFRLRVELFDKLRLLIVSFYSYRYLIILIHK